MATYNAFTSYQRTDLETASPLQLVQKVYRVAIHSCHQAVVMLESKDTTNARLAFLKAQEAITELMSSLDFERGGEVASSLFRIYEYMHTRLVRANIRKEADGALEVAGLLEDLAQAWSQVGRTGVGQQTSLRVQG